MSSALAGNYLRVESPSDGRTYTIDTDKTGVRRAMRPVAASTAAAKLPAWLYPGPGAQPSGLLYDLASGIVQADFLCGGTQEQIVAFYTQSLRAQGLRVSSLPLPGNRGVALTGISDALAIGVRVEPQSGSVQVHTTYTPRSARGRQHFEPVWYDDRSGVLRLRDTSTGDEYEIEKRAIRENNLNRVGGVSSEGARMPSWLPVYPGAAPSPKGRISWMFEPTAEFVTSAAIRRIYEYYLQELQNAGADITERSMTRSGKPLADISARIVARKGDDQVEIQISEVVWFGAGLAAARMAPATGIGVRYTVPLR